MLRYSSTFFLLVVFFGVTFLPVLAPLIIVRFRENHASGLVLGAAAGQNLSLQRDAASGSERFRLKAEVYGGQKTVYHEIALVKNNSPRRRGYSLSPTRRQKNDDRLSNFRVFFSRGKVALDEITLDPGESAFLNFEATARDSRPASFLVEINFLLETD